MDVRGFQGTNGGEGGIPTKQNGGNKLSTSAKNQLLGATRKSSEGGEKRGKRWSRMSLGITFVGATPASTTGKKKESEGV